MRDYAIKFFSYFGCSVHQNGQELAVELSPELTQHFGKPCLRLVFKPEQMNGDTEFLTYGSYISNRMYDLLKHSGEKLSTFWGHEQKTKQQ